MIVKVIIPAYNEEKSIGKVVGEIPSEIVDETVVVDNASTDGTSAAAAAAGATVIREVRSGYGSACLAGIRYIASQEIHPDIVVFLDGDYSDYPEEMHELVRPIEENHVDMVIGSRALGNREAGAMTPQQLFGNWLATRILKWKYNAEFTDLGPFRAIRFTSLQQLDMEDKDYGWTVEMQVKAARMGIRYTEVPVKYRKRIGHSKVSGTVKGTVLAGYKILYTLFKYR